MAKILKKFKNGYSESELFLLSTADGIIVRKINNVERNLARMAELSKYDVPVPRVFNITENSYDMEYIPNLDIKTFITHHDNTQINSFIYTVIDSLKSTTYDTIDFTAVYEKKLSEIDFKKYKFIFDKDELLRKLPKTVPVSQYHGDLTLDNMLYSTVTNSFILIDPITTDYSSYVFDIAKLRQDLKCKWFIRHDNDSYIEPKLKNMDEAISKFGCNNDYLLILMLMRILPYTKKSDDTDYLIDEINKLWK